MNTAVTDFVRDHIDGSHLQSHLSDQEKVQYQEQIKTLLEKNNAVLVAHYYTDPESYAILT